MSLFGNRKLLAIGLDGATFTILEPLIEAGKLPVLGRLREQGSWGTLESTFPPKTIPAWPVMATGKNPGKLGLFHFLNKANPSTVDEFVAFNSSMIEGETFWDYLGEAGRKVGVVNFPLLYPPYPVNGFMVSGLGASESNEITYPTSLREELDATTGGYEIRVPYADPIYSDNEELLIHDLTRVLNKRTEAVKYVMRNREWDVLFAIFSVTDWAQHYFWKHVDPTHCLYDGEKSPPLREAFEGFWTAVDHAVGEIVQQLDDEATVLVISDHGFGPVDQQFRVNAWLKRRGYLVESSNQDNVHKLKRAAFPLLEDIGGRIVKRCPQLNSLARRVGKRLSPSTMAQIDLERSDAFMPKQFSNIGTIYITHPRGTSEYLRAKTGIAKGLKALSENLPVSVKVYNPEDLYWGQKATLAPDVLFTINDFRCGMDPALSGPLFETNPMSENKTGMHRMEGILIAQGPNVAPGQIECARLIDIAPTILYLLGCPLPRDMDGDVLYDLFTSDFVRGQKAEYAENGERTQEAQGLSGEDEALLRSRLEELGYL
jgi:predicted AlkP superfamily phosphohydrolase/phosphomutase